MLAGHQHLSRTQDLFLPVSGIQNNQRSKKMDDTKFITNLLVDFGILPKKLVIALLNKQNPETAERLLRKMRNTNRIVPVREIYIAANRYCKPDVRNTTALWIVTRFLTEDGISGLYPCRLPSVVTFIRRNEAYEVIVINDGEDYLLAGSEVNKETKYIIVVPDAEKANTLRYLERFNETRFILATVNYVSMEDEPEICFFRRDCNESD